MAQRIVIVGGGVIGTACAYYLAKAGKTVTVLDRGEIGGACSHGNCGYVCPSHVLPLAVPGAIWATMKTAFARNSPMSFKPSGPKVLPVLDSHGTLQLGSSWNPPW